LSRKYIKEKELFGINSLIKNIRDKREALSAKNISFIRFAIFAPFLAAALILILMSLK